MGELAPPPPPPPPPPAWLPHTPSPRPRWLLPVVSIAVVVVVGGTVAAGVLVGRLRASSVPNASTVTPGSGTVVFSDDFRDPASGWTTTPAASGTTFTYDGDAYVVNAMGDLDHNASAPYGVGFAEASFSVTANQPTGSAPRSGYGVYCRTGSAASRVAYEFLLLEDGTWRVARRDGPVSTTTQPEVLGEGTAGAHAGPQAETVTAMCMTPGAGTTTTLLMFVNGRRVADLTDTDANLKGGSGWTGGLQVASRSTSDSTVVFTEFVERNVAP